MTLKLHDCAELTPGELRPIVREHDAPALHLTSDQTTIYWRSLGGYSSDGLILAYADREEGFASCAEQYRSLREELALLGLSPWSLVAAVGSRNLDPGDRFDLELVDDLIKSQELEWVATVGLDALSTNPVVSSMLPSAFDGVDMKLFPSSDGAEDPGSIDDGELLSTEEKEAFVSSFFRTVDIPGTEWAETHQEDGTYGLFLRPELADSDEAPGYLQLAAERRIPVYIGRTLNETVAERLQAHADRIAGGEDLDLDWFTARVQPAANARAAYRGKRAIVELVGTAPWQRSGFAG